MTTYEWSDWRNTDMVWIQVRMPLVYFPCPDPSTILLHTPLPPCPPNTFIRTHTRRNFRVCHQLGGGCGVENRACMSSRNSVGRACFGCCTSSWSKRVWWGVSYPILLSSLCTRKMTADTDLPSSGLPLSMCVEGMDGGGGMGGGFCKLDSLIACPKCKYYRY